MNMQEKIEKLINKVGTSYQMFYEDGNYLGCFFPVYEVYPHLPKFPLPDTDLKKPKNFDFGIARMLENMDEIKEESLQLGDILATRYNDELHVALYLGKGKFIHVFRDHTLQINSINFFKKDRVRYFRVK